MKKFVAVLVALMLLISCFAVMALPASAASGGTKTVQSGGYDLDLLPVIIVVAVGFLLIFGLIIIAIVLKNRNNDYDDDDEDDEDDDDDEPVIETENLEE